MHIETCLESHAPIMKILEILGRSRRVRVCPLLYDGLQMMLPRNKLRRRRSGGLRVCLERTFQPLHLHKQTLQKHPLVIVGNKQSASIFFHVYGHQMEIAEPIATYSCSAEEKNQKIMARSFADFIQRSSIILRGQSAFSWIFAIRV